ncbi:glycoside hydrolase family 3 N-terminal domain-containing protein [Flavobacterium sp. '19STA2R22 D10 B1']|uniref:glycoside hydrolase family 3 N-terminal domain-containing protein n=1 Tax=Flavobacterium aerium TaxID=3037261 RepID=UPI00278C5C79|nr:glycoside hydrolase family 3 N-terminal domain-containing protein [Flavobacterium sp. '19STA2R22 D10 B1']
MKYLVLLLLFFSQFAFVQNKKTNPSFNRTKETVWVDSVYNQMSFEERVGQLFMVAAYSNKDSAHIKSIDRLVKDYKIGGVIFFQGGPGRQARMTNRFQAESKLPLFIGIDAEWGISMRLDSTYRYPWNMTLGAIQDMKLVEKLGKQMGQESKRMGIHFNFAPVLDINTNPKNPIIGNRSFGEDKINVTERAIALMKGIQSQGVYSTGKHFPGHGDTSTDSHHALPTVNYSKEHLDNVELYPYKKLFKEGLMSVMVAHLNVPSLESRENYPSSISYNVVTELLQKELDFKGLIFTDALNMKGASNFKKPGEIDLEAFLAGNDILLFAENVPLAIEKFTEAYFNCTITDERLEYSVKKILKYKYRAGLNNYTPIDSKNLSKDLNKPDNDALQYQLFKNAITVLKNKNEILPIKHLERQKIAYVKLGDDVNSDFLNTLKQYTEVTEVSEANLDTLNLKLSEYTTVIVGYHKSNANAWKNHDFKEQELLWLSQIAKRNNNVILDVFAKPYSLMPVLSSTFEDLKGVIVSYQNSEISQNVSAQLIFGAIEAKGKLPVSINNDYKVNTGLKTKKLNILGFTAPENVDMNSAILSKIDDIAQKTIERKITPGMQILVARKGKVIYQKSFGYQTYDKDFKIQNSDVYDVASLTKILSTLPNVMKLVEEENIPLNTKLGNMLPVFSDTDKKNITLKEILSHNAGFQAWIPFYQATLDADKIPSKTFYRKIYSPEFPYQVAENLYIRKDYPQTILKTIADSKLGPKTYKYSDFGFIILKNYLEKETGKTLDVLSTQNFYKPLGANNTMYNPLQKFDVSSIPPTENDNYFRYQRIDGYVHDMGAAMEGGVGGHAGIFSNAMDVAKIMQMYLQKGNYANVQFFSKNTFDTFNTTYFAKEGNRRVLGFDKPQKGGGGPTCDCVSPESFGHSGFTGTFAWADPETEIVYIFLSNRTFPTAENNQLAKENIRSNIQQVIKDAIIE